MVQGFFFSLPPGGSALSFVQLLPVVHVVYVSEAQVGRHEREGSTTLLYCLEQEGG